MSAGRGGLPTSPFEVDATKEAVKRHIEAGDISQNDLDLLKKGYQWMTLSSMIGSAGLGLTTYFGLRRRVPPVSIGVRLLVSGGMGMLGSFLGFTMGGFAAALEVNHKMEDPKRKMAVFQQIAMEARQEALERSGVPGNVPSGIPRQPGGAGGIGGTGGFPAPITNRASGRSDATTWDRDPEAAREQEAEREREREFSSEIGRIEADGRFAGEAPAPVSVPTSTSTSTTGAAPRAGDGGWDRIRQQAFSRPAPREDKSTGQEIGGTAGTGPGTGTGAGIRGLELDDLRSRGPLRELGVKRDDQELSEEQRKFDELLEKERRGVGETEAWR